MGKSIFQSQQVKAPFLGKAYKQISGLDQLGLNLTSERIFELLLPGLNNVTQRLRYYTFYCWFFDWYASEIRNTSTSQQNIYLRRSEFILALIAAHNGQGGIPGITRALTVYENCGNEISLLLGTQEGKSSEGSYWKNPRGVLGQYYISSIKQMGILVGQGQKDGLYIRTESEDKTQVSGKQLADAFIQNTIGTLDIFTRAILNNCVTKMELEELSIDFNMLEIPESSDEYNLLWKLFSGVDKPKEKEETYYRKETIKLLLTNVAKSENDENYNELNFPFAIYENGWRSDYGKTEKLWYSFIVEQFWSMSCTGCLNAFLKILDCRSNNNWIDEITLIKQISKSVAEEFENLQGPVKSDQFFNNLISNESVRELIDLSKSETNPYRKIYYSLKAIQRLYLENRQSAEELLTIFGEEKLFKDSSFLKTYTSFDKRKDMALSGFIEYFLIRFVINKHHLVALHKLNATQNSAKFYREDGFIKYVDNFIYDYSSPRIHTIYEFMEDLNIIERDTTALTSNGIDYLNILK